MDWKKIILTIVIIPLLIYGGYIGYRYVSGLSGGQSVDQEMIKLLQEQSNMIIKLKTDIADVERRVVAGELKETIIIRDEGQTYEGVKEELIALRENETENKEKIDELRKVFEQRITEFRESEDKIMVKSGDEKIILYEDETGSLVSLSEGVEIIRHRKVEPLLEKPDLIAGQTEEEINDKFSFSLLYHGNIVPALSYSVMNWNDFNLNLTAYDFESIKLGADVSYKLKGNFEIGAGMGFFDIINMDTMRDFYVRLGFRIEF